MDGDEVNEAMRPIRRCLRVGSMKHAINRDAQA